MVPGCAGAEASKQSKGYKKTRAYGDVFETEVVGLADGWAKGCLDANEIARNQWRERIHAQMAAWMGGWMSGWTEGMKEWMKGWMNECEWMQDWKTEWTIKRMNDKLNDWMNAWEDENESQCFCSPK